MFSYTQQQLFESEAESEAVVKDDNSPATIATYYVLLFLFLSLALFGTVNIYLANKIRNFSKPMVTFYFASLFVIFFRVLLFCDPFAEWDFYTYVILLISMPSYFYLLVGLSQVMVILESIVKYKNFTIREEEAITHEQLLVKMA